MASNGWISLHRKLQSHWLWENDKPFDKRSAWIDILLLVNHQPGKVYFNKEIIKIDIGEHITSEVKLSKKWGWSRTKVRNFLKLLKQDNMIKVTKKDKKRTRLKVLNYSDYQNTKNNRKTTKKQQKNNRKTTEKQQKDINNNVNKNNNNNKSNICPLDRKKKTNGLYKYPDDYEKIYEKYPYQRGNKSKGWRKWKARREDNIEQEKLFTAAKNYNEHVKNKKIEEQYVKHIATFYGPDNHWKDFLELEKEIKPVEGMKVVYE